MMREQENRKKTKQPISDSEILSYSNLLNDYMQYIESYKKYTLEYEDLYKEVFSEILSHYTGRLNQKFNNKIMTELNDDLSEDKLDDILLRKKKYIDEKISSLFNEKFYSDIHKKLSDRKPINSEVLNTGTLYRSSVTHGITYMEVRNINVRQKPSGWKLHLYIDKNKRNLEKSWDILSRIILKYQLAYAKISHFNGNPKPGTEITIYQSLDIGKRWDKIIEEIEIEFKGIGIRPSTKTAEGDRIVNGSNYITYRNDSLPGIKGTFRPEHIKELIVIVADKIKGKENDLSIKILVEKFIKSKYNDKIIDEDTVNRMSGKLVENVKGALSINQNLSELEFNPFNMEDNPNQNVNLERRPSLNSR